MIVTSADQVPLEERIDWLGHNYAIDVETEGLEFMVVDLIGVALYVNGKSYYFVLKHSLPSGEVAEYLSLTELRMILAPLLSQREVVASLHNSKFDRHFFERYGLSIQSRWFDTLYAARLLDENRRNGLKDLTPLVDDTMVHVKYGDLAVYPQWPKNHPYAVPLKDFGEYAEKDVIVTYKLFQKFRVEMTNDAYRGITSQDVFNTLYTPMTPVLQGMESWGFKIDVAESQALYDHYSKVIEEKSIIVQKAGYQMLAERDPSNIEGFYWKQLTEDDEPLTYDDGRMTLEILGVETPVIRPTPRSNLRKLYFNTASPKQLVDLIINEVRKKLPSDVELTTTKGGDDSVNYDNIMVIKHYLGDDTPHYIDALLEWRKATKFVTSYLEAFLHKTDENNRIHCNFSIVMNDQNKGGTRTGRLSSSDINLQNIPSRGIIGLQARGLFIAGENNVLIAADYSNMETVIFAHFSSDPVLLKAFSENLDVHALTACGQHGLDYENFVAEYKNGNPKYDAMRRTAKTILFGQAYGMGAAKLQRQLLVQNGQEYTLDDARNLLAAFNETYHVMNEWKAGVNDFAGKHGFVPTILGRKRRLPNVFSRDRTLRSRAQRQGVNAVIQGSCADILFQAMVPIQSSFQAMGGSLVASVHDELIGELPEEFAVAGKTVMETLMVDLINPRLRCKLKAEAGVGKTWKEAKG